MEKISKYISYAEAIKSDTAIKNNISNTPNITELEAMKEVGSKVFDKVREHFGKPLYISSFFRSSALNKKVGGSISSQHCYGQAIDIDADTFNNGVTNAQIFNYIKDNLDYDQLIWEFGTSSNPDWVHVSYVSPEKNRRIQLKAVKSKGRTSYQRLN